MSEEINSANIPEGNAAPDTQAIKEPEAADPVEEVTDGQETEQGTENQEDSTGNEPERDFEKDAAYAEMRRAKEEAEKTAAAQKAELEEIREKQREAEFESQRTQAYAEIQKHAIENELTEEEIRQLQSEVEADLEKEKELQTLRDQNETLKQQAADMDIERRAMEDVQAIKKLDPTVKSIEDLSENFITLRNIPDGEDGVYLTVEQAYFAAKAMEGKLEEIAPKAPDEVGFSDTSTGSKTFYSKLEVDNMTPDEVSRNLDLIQESMKRWGKGDNT